MAGQEIGSLFVALGLDSAVFTAGVAKVKGATAGLQKGLEGIGKKMEAMGQRLSIASAAMVAVGTAAAVLVKQTAAAASEIDRQAKLANASTTEFQRWAAGAKKAGIGQDKLADILKDVNDRVGEFNATGSGPMLDFFENVAPKVGVTAEQFKNLSGPQALQLYVSSLEKAGLSQQEMTFYLEAMASDATALIPLLKNGGVEMTRFGDAAEASGAVMSEGLIAKSKVFNEKWGLMMQSIDGVKNKLAEALMPVVTQMVEYFTANVIPAIDAVVGKIGTMIEWFSGLPEPIQQFAAIIGTVFAVGGPTLLAMSAAVSAIGLITGALRAMAMATLLNPVVIFGVALAGIAYVIYDNWDFLKKEFLAMLDSMAAAAKKAKDAILSALTIGKESMNSGTGYGGMVGAGDEFSGGMFSGGGQSTGSDTAAGVAKGFVAGMAAGQGRIEGAIQKHLIDASNDKLGIQSPSRVFMAIGDFITQGLGLGIKSGMPQVQGAMAGITDAVTDKGQLTEGLYKFRDTARDVFSQVAFQGGKLGDVLKQKLSSFLGNAASNLFNSGFNELWGGLGLPTFANGTDNFRGGLAQVNERGGEIMNLPSGTQIIPHDVSKRMADRSGSAADLRVTVVMDPSTGAFGAFVEDKAGRMIAKAEPVIVQQAVKAASAASRATKGAMGVR